MAKGKDEKRGPGAVTSYTEEVAEQIIEFLSDGVPLREICRKGSPFPSWRTVYNWMAADQSFASRIAHAREIGEEAIFQDALNIADTPMIGEETEQSENGLKVKRADMLGHRKLQIETRLKLLSKWNPKKYGERQTVDMNVTNPLADRLARARKRNDG